MGKIAVITANLGGIDNDTEPVKQSVPFDIYRFNDSNYPLRYCAMKPRLQARIPKMFAWQMKPGYKFYIWVDSSLQITNPDTVKWFREACTGFDAVFFQHPDRKTIQAEADFIKLKLLEDNYYLKPRYDNELIDEQMAEIKADKDFKDELLIASSAFIYRNNEKVRLFMKEWWYHTSRYHSVDQLGLPYAIYKSKIKINLLKEHYMKTKYLTYIGHK